jgi:hypothetical protein
MRRFGMAIACDVLLGPAATRQVGQVTEFEMATWRFYQGLRNEWRWYHLDERNLVLTASDRGFAELDACMENAERAGFNRSRSFQVHARATPKDRTTR